MSVFCRSAIDGEFEGTESETVFKLLNGQSWQQIGYHYHYHYHYCPTVVIEQHGFDFIMSIQDFPHKVPVRRID